MYGPLINFLYWLDPSKTSSFNAWDLTVSGYRTSSREDMPRSIITRRRTASRPRCTSQKALQTLLKPLLSPHSTADIYGLCDLWFSSQNQSRYPNPEIASALLERVLNIGGPPVRTIHLTSPHLTTPRLVTLQPMLLRRHTLCTRGALSLPF